MAAASGSSLTYPGGSATTISSFGSSCSSFLGRPTNHSRISALFASPSCFIGKEICVTGWSRTVRKGGQLCFISLNDGSTSSNLQVVVESGVENFDKLVKCVVGCSFQFVGDLIESPCSGQKVELSIKKHETTTTTNHKVILYGSADPAKYPLAKKHHSRQFLREIGHLRSRTLFIGAIARVRSEMAFATHSFFRNRGFTYIHTPIITAADCEGAGELFQVTSLLPNADQKCENRNTSKPIKRTDKQDHDEEDLTCTTTTTHDDEYNVEESSRTLYSLPLTKTNQVDYKKEFFGKPTYLTVSGQLAVENYCCGVGDVYTFGPTFRAEHSHTSRHLAEFWMIEPELAFADLNDNMNCAEQYLKFCLHWVITQCHDDLMFLQQQCHDPVTNKQLQTPPADAATDADTDENNQPLLIDRLNHILNSPFQRITYTDAVQTLADHNDQFVEKVTWGLDLSSEHERYLTEKIYKKPVIVYNYPKAFKAFYMRLNNDGQTVAAMDVLLPHLGEVIGGSQREERLAVLDQRLAEKQLNPKAYWWYRELRMYGSIPHSGFGVGFERLLMLVTGVDNIRDVIPYPRYPGHADY